MNSTFRRANTFRDAAFILALSGNRPRLFELFAEVRPFKRYSTTDVSDAARATVYHAEAAMLVDMDTLVRQHWTMAR